MRQQTMVYRKAGEGASRTVERDGVTFEYDILDLDDGDAAPDGWSRTLDTEAQFTPAKPKKHKPVKAADDNDT